MNKKIKNYVDVLFADVPKTNKALELKEEMIANMTERYDDYISQGKTENEAYTQTVAGVGDVDAMLNGLQPDANFMSQVNYYRTRKGLGIAVGVALYILGVAALILLACFGGEMQAIIGVVALLVAAAIATGIIVFVNVAVPYELLPYTRDRNDQDEFFDYTPQDHDAKRKRAIILSVYWPIITALYLLLSFLTGAWHITWIIWVVATAGVGIINLCFLLGGSNEH